MWREKKWKKIDKGVEGWQKKTLSQRKEVILRRNEIAEQGKRNKRDKRKEGMEWGEGEGGTLDWRYCKYVQEEAGWG
jgi:hypothetical protein